MSTAAQRLVSQVQEVYTLPNIYYKIDDAINNPGATASHIGRILAEDTGLSARLLRLVNSAFFGFPSKVDTISRAVTVIGTRQLRELVLATSVVKIFEGIPDNVLNMEMFWRHSIATAVASRILATFRNESNAERFFVAGLLHDLGSLLIYSQLPEQGHEVLQRARSSEALMHKVEREVLGFDHAQVGGLLLAEWKLPPGLVEMVSYHHQPFKASRVPTETATVHLADIIAHALELGSNGEAFVPPLDEKACSTLDIPKNLLQRVLSLLERHYQDAVNHILTR